MAAAASRAVDVYSLDEREQRRVAKTLRKALGGDVDVLLPPPLLRSELKGIKLQHRGDRGTSAGMILLCHYNEGRILLTDEDGMYNDFIMEACRMTNGNVFVALAPVSTSDDVLANEKLVTALAYSGGQQGLLSIHMQGRFLTWDRQPSQAQIECLKTALAGTVVPLEISEAYPNCYGIQFLVDNRNLHLRALLLTSAAKTQGAKSTADESYFYMFTMSRTLLRLCSL